MWNKYYLLSACTVNNAVDCLLCSVVGLAAASPLVSLYNYIEGQSAPWQKSHFQLFSVIKREIAGKNSRLLFFHSVRSFLTTFFFVPERWQLGNFAVSSAFMVSPYTGAGGACSLPFKDICWCCLLPIFQSFVVEKTPPWDWPCSFNSALMLKVYHSLTACNHRHKADHTGFICTLMEKGKTHQLNSHTP